MKAAALASQYSKALLKLSSSEKKMEQYLKDLHHVVHLLDNSPELLGFLCAPIFKSETQKNVIQKLLADKIDPALLHFLFILIENKRFQFLREIMDSYHYLVKQALNILEVQVITAIPLEKEAQHKLQSKLEKLYNKKIEIQPQIDPSIIGGAIFIIDRKIADNSIKGRLAQLKQDLLAIKLK